MKTLTLHINESIYEDVKRFLALFSPEKIKIEKNRDEQKVLESDNLSGEELKKMISFLNKFDIPIPENLNKTSRIYDIEDFEVDKETMETLDLLK